MGRVQRTVLVAVMCMLTWAPTVALGFGEGSTLCKKICSNGLLSMLNKSQTVQCWTDCREKIDADVSVVSNDLCNRRYTKASEREVCRTALHELRNYLVNGEISSAAP